jgi:CheY-like chemotaxis protein
MIVDDEPLMGSVLRRILSAYDVVAVQHPNEALDRLRADPTFDLIFVDVMLPAMNGTELQAELARTHPELAARVVFLTGGAFSPEARAAIERSALPVIEKPFDRAKLLALVDARLRHRQG